MKIIEYIYGTFCAICVIVGIGYAISNGSPKSNSNANIYHSSKPYNHYQKSAHIQQIQDKKALDDFVNQKAEQFNKTHSITSPVGRQFVGTPRDNYQDLWNECEALISALDDAGIDHEGLSYPMDYYELRNLKDELESTAEENDVEW